MSTDNDVARSLRSWLLEDRHEDADRILTVVFDRVPVTPQGRLWWPAQPVTAGSNKFRLAVGAAVLVIAAILGYSYLNRNVGADRSTPTPNPSATAPVELPAAGDIAPGTYFLANPCKAACPDYQRIIFTLPAGWATGDGLIYKHLDGPDEVTFSAWAVYQVYADPCHWQTSALGPLDLADGQTHQALHDAGAGSTVPPPSGGGLSHQAGRNASALTQAHLGGELALKVELSVPSQLDLTACDQGEFRSWTEWITHRPNSHNAPGQVDVVYMVDLDRRPLVIDASQGPSAPAADVAELDTILASMVIDRSQAPAASASPFVFEFPSSPDAVSGPGTYSLDRSFPVGITFEAPFPWVNCSQGPLEVGVCLQSSRTLALGFLIVANVVADPCASDAKLLDPRVGPTVDDLVAAISSLAGFDATPASDISVDGYHGKQFHVTAPDLATCNLLTWATAIRVNGVGPGEVNLIRILDVNGTRVVITAAYRPAESSTQDVADLMYALNSVHIEL